MSLKANSIVASACGVAMLALSIASCSGRSSASAAPTSVTVVPAARAVRIDLSNSATLTAEFQPFFQVDVMAKEAGYVRHMYVDIGDHVKAGQLLATLEIPELQDSETQAKADLQTANAEQAAAQGNLKRAEAGQAIAHLSYTRILDVSKKEPGLVPVQEVDVAHSRDLEGEAQLAAAQQNVQAAASRSQAATAALAHATSLFAYSRITTPFDGVITQRYASDGSMIQAGTASQTQAMPVVTVSKNDVLRLMLPVPEQNVSAIHDGAKVSVLVPTLGKTFTGTVTRFADSVQTSTRTMTAEVDVKNPDFQLMPGMYAQVQLSLATAPNAIAVPVEALDGSGAEQKVFVVDDAGTVQIRKIKTGIQSPAYVQILSGVQPGDAVIVGRHSDYRQGQRVKPRFEDATPAPAAHS